ncbi:MAG: response regulator transcription factor [Bacteroidota bacterium]
MPSENIHVAIVEDDNDIRETLALIINGTPGFTCKLVYSDCESAIADLPNQYARVVLMDIQLPGKSGIEGVRILKPKLNEVDFVMLSIQQDDESIFNAIKAGASGYLVKDTPPAELLRAITEVCQGGAPMSANIARKVIQSFHASTVAPSPLSERETEILKFLCEGQNYRTIAEKLFVSPHTVRTHIKNIYKKLHVSSRAEAVRKAVDDRLV